MKTIRKKVLYRQSFISLDVEKRKLQFRLTMTFDDDSVDSFDQEFNLDMMPYEMAMSVICSLLNPQNHGNGKPTKL